MSQGKRAVAAEVSKKHCGGCFHLIHAGQEPCCNYLVNVGRMRPCPAGKGCTEYITEAAWQQKKNGPSGTPAPTRKEEPNAE